MEAIITVRDLTEAMLHRWLPTAIAHVSVGLEERLPYPQSWHQLVTYDEVKKAHQLPAVIVHSELADVSRRSSDRLDLDVWVNVTVVARGNGWKHTLDVNDLYRAAIVLAHLQDRTLGGQVEPSTGWEDRYEVIPDGDRTLLAGTVRWLVTVPDVIGELPPVPPVTEADPSAPYTPAPRSTVETTHLDLHQRS